MRPIEVGNCFGWLHTPVDDRRNDIAVLVCPGLLGDELVAYCALRVLAEELARAGFWTVRLAYPGTGDSCDNTVRRSDGHWTTWQDSIAETADWLRRASGVPKLVICGMRAGALLAALAAARRTDVAGLLLFEPTVSGRSYVRQLKLDAELHGGRALPGDGGIEVGEFEFSGTTIEQIAATDLRTLPPSAEQRVAVFSRAETRLVDECLVAWRHAGAEVTAGGWSRDLDSLIGHPTFDAVQLPTYRAAIDWMAAAFPAAQGSLPGAVPPLDLPAEATLLPEDCVETTLHFGPDRRLFGIVCDPQTGPSRHAVIIVNGGRDPRYGASRQGVGFARRLARCGFSSLRADFAGLGDSLGPRGRENIISHAFADRTSDIRAMIDALEARGHERFTIQGICSGAFHAFHAALAEHRIGALILVNQPLFTLPRSLAEIAYLDHDQLTPLFYLRKLSNLNSWRALVSGRVDIGMTLHSLWVRGLRYLRRTARGIGRLIGLVPKLSFAQSALGDLCARGVKTLFLLSPAKQDLEPFRREFTLEPRALARYRGSEVRIVPRMDHALISVDSRHDAAVEMIDFLRKSRL
ncbi:serine aminopeptidase domain-containing protein [Reyranella sp.]|uniref:serine aminopeptidase domain-containing protein n=1 Tax=Reyranella sp. TaxID=1929291 RepID=UPI003D098BAF